MSDLILMSLNGEAALAELRNIARPILIMVVIVISIILFAKFGTKALFGSLITGGLIYLVIMETEWVLKLISDFFRKFG
jgi:hypothetical protein